MQEKQENFENKNMLASTNFFGKAKPTVQTSVKISPEFYNLCKINRITFSEAMRVGISVLLADRGVVPYDNKLNLWRKMNLFRQKAEDAVQKVEELTTKLAERENIEIENNKRTIQPEE